jgi:ABC-type transport system substrate-binding protein
MLMNKRTKTILATGSLALVLAGTGAGVAAAQTSTTPTPPGTASSSTPTPAAKTAKHPHHKGGQLRRVEHGEFTVHTKTGDKVLDTQRGVVTAVNAGSVTVKSTDGFTATYTLNPATKVHKGKQTATTAQITTNDRVRVLANKTGTTDTATRIGDAGPAK